TWSKCTEYRLGRLYSMRPSRWNFRYGNERNAKSTCSLDVYDCTDARAGTAAKSFAVSSADGAGASASMPMDAAIKAARCRTFRTIGLNSRIRGWVARAPPWCFGERPPGNVLGRDACGISGPENDPGGPGDGPRDRAGDTRRSDAARRRPGADGHRCLVLQEGNVADTHSFF